MSKQWYDLENLEEDVERHQVQQVLRRIIASSQGYVINKMNSRIFNELTDYIISREAKVAEKASAAARMDELCLAISSNRCDEYALEYINDRIAKLQGGDTEEGA